MSETRQKFLCEAVATTVDGAKLFITVYQVGSGIEFTSGTGSMKYGTPLFLAYSATANPVLPIRLPKRK